MNLYEAKHHPLKTPHKSLLLPLLNRNRKIRLASTPILQNHTATILHQRIALERRTPIQRRLERSITLRLIDDETFPLNEGNIEREGQVVELVDVGDWVLAGGGEVGGVFGWGWVDAVRIRGCGEGGAPGCYV